MPLTWEILIVINITISFLIVIRFYKSKYFFYFLILSLTDPFYILAHYLLKVTGYHYMAVALTISLLFIPANNKKHIIVAIPSIALLIPYFAHSTTLPTLLSTVASTYLIYFFIEELMNEFKKSTAILLFIPAMIFNILKDNLKIYLYFLHNDILTQYFTWFLVIGAMISLIIAYMGPAKKIKINFKTDSSSFKPLNKSDQSNLHLIHLAQPYLLKDLSTAEIRVLTLMAEGFKSNEIADKLCIDRRTVYFHNQNIKNKLNIDTSLRLALFAIENREYLLKSIKPAHIDRMVK